MTALPVPERKRHGTISIRHDARLLGLNGDDAMWRQIVRCGAIMNWSSKQLAFRAQKGDKK